MENWPPAKVLRLLFQRRRRRVWAYAAWLLVYIFTALYFAGDTGAEPRQMLPFLIPLAFVVLQLIYPTLFVWALIVIPSVLYSCIGVCYMLRNLDEKQWQYDMQGVVLGSIVIAIYIAVSIGLICSRPKRVQPNNALQPTATAP